MNLRIRTATAAVAALGALLTSVACGDVVRQGRSPAFIVIDKLQAASGFTPGEFGVPLLSDVKTKGSIYNDLGQASMRLVLKDPTSPNGPSTINAITITQYHVQFRRSDGRNTQGVDVPYAFDGAMTATITDSASNVVFELVRHSAKEEAPLKALVDFGGRVLISAVADVTFYGHDQAGNEIQVTGSITIDFGDFADPTT